MSLQRRPTTPLAALSRVVVPLPFVVVLGALLGAAPALGDQGRVTARLRAFDEVPAQSSPGGGRFEATINDEGTEVFYDLTYLDLDSDVTQAHIHFAQRGVNGAIIIFLCSNLGNAPVGTPACPLRAGQLTGSFTAEDLITGASQTTQGVGQGEFPNMVRAIKTGTTYVNIHTVAFPGGQIRGQLEFRKSD